MFLYESAQSKYRDNSNTDIPISEFFQMHSYKPDFFKKKKAELPTYKQLCGKQEIGSFICISLVQI